MTALAAYKLLAGGTSDNAALQQVATLGSSGQYLKSNGAAALPSWGTINRVTPNVVAVNAATYDLVATDDILDVTYTATGAVTNLRLMTAQMVVGRTIVVKDGGGNSGTNNITITTEGAEKIDGADTLVIKTNYAAMTLTVNAAGTGWLVI